MGWNRLKSEEQTALDLLDLVYRSFGYKLPRTSSELRSAGRKVSYHARNSQEISSVIMDMLLCTLEMERLYMQAAEKQELRFLKEQITAVLFV